MTVMAGPPSINVNVHLNAAPGNLDLARPVNVPSVSVPPAGGNPIAETNRAATLNAMADAATQAAVDAEILARDTVEAAMQAGPSMADAGMQAGPAVAEAGMQAGPMMADAGTQAYGGMRYPRPPIVGRRRPLEQ